MMSGPPMQPPMDPDHRALIDQLAQHVAVNGPQAQEAARHTHYGDPRYTFLFDGGEHNDYYRWRMMGQVNAMGPRPPQPPPQPLMGAPGQFFPPAAPAPRTSFGPPPPMGPSGGMGARLPPPGLFTPPPGLVHAPRLASIGMPQPPPPRPLPPSQLPPSVKASPSAADPKMAEKIAELKKQIADSEANLRAHQEQLQLQKTQRVENEWREREGKRLQDLFAQAALSLHSFETQVDRLSQSGSKDSVSSAKKWIFENCTTDRQREVCLTYLLHRARCKGASEQLKLHMLYLMNDWAHYCHRKNLDSIRQMLSRYVPKLYAYASSAITATGDHHLQEKLEKLISVWDSARYFDDNCQKQMRNTTATLNAELSIIIAEQQRITVEMQLEMEATLKGYEKQHQDYEKHILTKIAQLEAEQLQRERNDAELAARRSAPTSALTTHYAHPTAAVDAIPFTTAPKCPYWELPAGMMVPLVAIDDCTYKPIEVAKLRASLQAPPNEHLLKQLDRFYQFQSAPDNPRDADGWEAKGLLDYYVKKAEARVKLELELKKEGKSFEDVVINKYIPPNPSGEEAHYGRKRRRSSSASSNSSSRSSSSSDDRGRDRQRGRRSRSPERPSFSSGFKMPSVPAPLDRETNKGAQLMAKMGWEGGGLGAKEQGIEEPIHGGHIRSRGDKYVGVGVTPITALLHEPQEDPFAEYRRQMSLKKLSTFKK